MESGLLKLAEIPGAREVPEEEGKEKSRPHVKDDTSSKVSNDEGEDESVVLNKNGKETVPIQKHKELWVENDLIFE